MRLRFGSFELVKFCETKIQNFHLPVFSNKDVRRLDVAMDDALLVRGFETLRDLDCDIKQSWCWQI